MRQKSLAIADFSAFLRRVAPGALVAGTVLLVFTPVLRCGFLNWDDNLAVTANPHLVPSSLEGLIRLWTAPYEGLYVPVSQTLFAAQVWLCELLTGKRGAHALEPVVFHAANWFLHALSAYLVFDLLRLLTNQAKAAVLGALAFALHPLQVESVAWVTEARGLLSGCLSLFALGQYIRFGVRRGPQEPAVSGRALWIAGARYALAVAAWIAALLAKPSAVALPLQAWVLDVFWRKERIGKASARLLPWLVVAALFSMYSKSLQSDGVLAWIPPLWLRPLIAADALVFYVVKLVSPLGLAADYGRTPAAVMDGRWVYFAWVVPLALAFLAAIPAQRRTWLSSFGLFTAALVPVLGFVPFGFQNTSTVADRYVYMAMLGPALAVAHGFLGSRRRSWAVVVVVIGTAWVVLDFRQIGYWRNMESLFSRALDVNPKSATAHNNLGLTLFQAGRLADAKQHFQSALGGNPAAYMAHNNLGLVLLQEQKPLEAALHFEAALRLLPDFVGARVNLGISFAQRGATAQAIAEYERALVQRPDCVEAHNHFGLALAKLGRLEEAVSRYRKALAFDPTYAPAHNNLGLALERLGRTQAAELEYREALHHSPGFADAQNNLATLLVTTGRIDEALAHFRDVLEQRPDSLEAHFNLGVALHAKGSLEDAEKHLREALQIRPGFGPAEALLKDLERR